MVLTFGPYETLKIQLLLNENIPQIACKIFCTMFFHWSLET